MALFIYIHGEPSFALICIWWECNLYMKHARQAIFTKRKDSTL